MNQNITPAALRRRRAINSTCLVIIAASLLTIAGFLTGAFAASTPLAWSNCNRWDWEKANYGTATLNNTIPADFTRFAETMDLDDLPHTNGAVDGAHYLPTAPTAGDALTCSMPIKPVGTPGINWDVVEDTTRPDVIILTAYTSNHYWHIEADIRPANNSHGYEVTRIGVGVTN